MSIGFLFLDAKFSKYFQKGGAGGGQRSPHMNSIGLPPHPAGYSFQTGGVKFCAENVGVVSAENRV